MSHRTRIALVGLAVIFLGVTKNPTLACTCLHQHPCEAFQQADFIFIGAARSISESWEESFRTVRFEVHKVFKGSKVTETMIYTGMGGGDCGYPFQVGQRYLVYASRFVYKKDNSTSLCSRTSPLYDTLADREFGVDSKIDLRYLTRSKRNAAMIVGKVQGPNSLRRMAGLWVKATGASGTYKAKTDRWGIYALENMAAGTYTISVATPKNLTVESRTAMSLEIKKHECLEFNIAIVHNGSIRGTVRTQSGEPLTNAPVDLITSEYPYLMVASTFQR